MSAAVESRLRRFLLLLSAFVCFGTIVELLLVGHTESRMQIVPIIAAAVGGLSSGLAVRRELLQYGGRLLNAHRGSMSGLIAISALGVYQHLRANYLFEREIKPASSITDAFVEALVGASPLIASGVLALAGLCGLMATVGYPSDRSEEPAP